MEKKKDGVSRQTLWQRKHRALGLCVVCSEPAYKGWRCVKHYEQHKIVMRLRYIPRVRGRYDVGGSMEFLEAASRRKQSRGPALAAGGPFGPLPAPVVQAEAAAAPAKPAATPGKDGRTLQAKRNRAATPRAQRTRARATRTR
jgi:hypothetical protein